MALSWYYKIENFFSLFPLIAFDNSKRHLSVRPELP